MPGGTTRQLCPYRSSVHPRLALSIGSDCHCLASDWVVPAICLLGVAPINILVIVWQRRGRLGTFWFRTGQVGPGVVGSPAVLQAASWVITLVCILALAATCTPFGCVVVLTKVFCLRRWLGKPRLIVVDSFRPCSILPGRCFGGLWKLVQSSAPRTAS